MAQNTIKVDVSNTATATQAIQLKDFSRQLRVAYDMGVKIRETMNYAKDGTIFTMIETLYGLPAGQGQIVYDLVNGSVGAMEGTFQNDDCKQISSCIV